MTVTSTDITNRALQLIGTRTTVASLGEQSNEAIQANLVYTTTVNWCFTACNWNFARKVALLTQVKTVSLPGAWSTSSPMPPWTHEFAIPSDFLRAIYLTNSDANGTVNFYGQPKRFDLAVDTITAVVQEVLLTNESSAVLVYTALISDPTLWPSYFERFVVATLARTLCMALTGDKELRGMLDQTLKEAYVLAESVNKIETLRYDSPTPEWITAVGIPYPENRLNRKPQLQQRQNDVNNQY